MDEFLAAKFRHFSEKMSAVTLELVPLEHPSLTWSFLAVFLYILPEYSGQK
jgi:hypothetical protein